MRWLLIATIVCFCASVSNGMSLTCYYASWAVYRPGQGKCDIEDLNPYICSHLVYSFIGINENGTIRLQDPKLDIDKNAFYRFTALKKLNPKLKTMVALGGWGEPPAIFSKVASDKSKRIKFIDETIIFLKQYNFDGLDMDWEYPTTRGGTPQDKENFSSFLKEFRTAFDKYGFILTAAVAAIPAQVQESYNIAEISKWVHSIHVMTYDLHSSLGNFTGENSPMYASSSDEDKTRNADAAVQYFLQNGAPPHKVIMGIPSYGLTYTLSNSSSINVGSASLGPGYPGNFTGQAGVLAYYEICSMFNTTLWDHEQKVPYAVNDDQWVGYDNPRSVKYKMWYARKYKLGGVMVWTIDMDDFRGMCGMKYPLLSTINKYKKKITRKKTKASMKNKIARKLLKRRKHHRRHH